MPIGVSLSDDHQPKVMFDALRDQLNDDHFNDPTFPRHRKQNSCSATFGSRAVSDIPSLTDRFRQSPLSSAVLIRGRADFVTPFVL